MGKHKLVITLLVVPLLFSLAFEPTLLAEASSNISNDDWPMFHHDSAHTGFTNSSAPTSMPREVWSTGPMADYLTSPAIVDGIIYMTGYSLFAFNSSTGEIIWEQVDKGYTSPVVEKGVVYTSAGAFNASTGTELWRINGQQVVAVADGYYYTDFVNRQGDNNMLLIALNASTGASIWNYTVLGLASNPAVAGGYIYFGTPSGVSALDAYTGTKLWDFEIGVAVESSLTAVDGRIFVSAGDKNLYCIDSLTGKALWNYTIDFGSSPASAYGYVYVASRNGNIYAFNASTGAKLWNYTTLNTIPSYGVESSPAIAHGTVFVSADDGNLYAFNASTGAKLWNYKIGEPQHLRCSPSIANGRIYIGSQDNFIMVLETAPLFNLHAFEIGLAITILMLSLIGIFLYKKYKASRLII